MSGFSSHVKSVDRFCKGICDDEGISGSSCYDWNLVSYCKTCKVYWGKENWLCPCCKRRMRVNSKTIKREVKRY